MARSKDSYLKELPCMSGRRVIVLLSADLGLADAELIANSDQCGVPPLKPDNTVSVVRYMVYLVVYSTTVQAVAPALQNLEV